MNRIFVYGTLKRGGSNHDWMTGQRFVTEARTVPGFRLYSLGDYPGMVPDATDVDGVLGELWDVSASCLQRLDELEGINEGLYRRVRIALRAPHDGESVETYLYARGVAGLAALGPVWREPRRN